MISPALHAMLAVCPVLGTDCTVTPTVIREEHWVVVKNVITGEHIRLHRDLWLRVLQFDGKTSVQVWVKRHAPDFCDQRLISVIVQLQRLSVLDVELPAAPSVSIVTRLFVRFNPLMLRIGLFNPAALLDMLCRTLSSVSVRVFFIGFMTVVFAALYVTVMNWSSVMVYWQSIDNRTQFWQVVLLYPLTKCLHELAHGLMLGRLGGRSHEAGVSFIVLFPMPYVDVTDAWTLHRKQRMQVTAAGMMMDLFLACAGILIWVNISSGIFANLAFTLAVMGSVSILLFNANPLLKFDGYYLLEDALDSPGLARRSQAYYRYVFKRYVLMLEASVPPAVGPGEKAWLLIYGVASTVYRFFISAIICVYLISTLHEIGVLLSLFSLIPLCVFPVYRFLQFLFVSGELANLRIRTISVTAVLGLVVSAFLMTVPMPSSTRTQGVVWVDQQAEVYAAQTGQLERILVNNGDFVEKGQPLMELRSVELEHLLVQKLAAASLARLKLSHHRQGNPSLAVSAQIHLRQSEAEVDNTRKQIDKLLIRAPAEGRVAIGNEHIATGLHVPQGTLLAYVVDDHERVVRAVVDQTSLGDVEAGVDAVQIRLAHNITRSLNASIARQIPSGSHQLPSAALIARGFDGFDVDRVVDGESARTIDKVFHLELVINDSIEQLHDVPMGTRAYVTLEHASEPLASRWIRKSRQLLLKHLDV